MKTRSSWLVRPLRFSAVAVGVGLVAAACSAGANTAVHTNSASTTSSSVATAGAPVTTAAGSMVTISSASVAGKTVLVNGAGRTLYHLSADQGTSVACTGSCLTYWPPVLVSAGQTPELATGLTGTVAALMRADGTHQVTYNGLTLYTYSGDTAAGQAKGQGVVDQSGSVKGTWSEVTVGETTATANNTSGAAPASPTTSPPTTGAATTTTSHSPGTTQGPTTTQAPTTTRPPATTTTTTRPPATTTTTLPASWS